MVTRHQLNLWGGLDVGSKCAVPTKDREDTLKGPKVKRRGYSEALVETANYHMINILCYVAKV